MVVSTGSPRWRKSSLSGGGGGNCVEVAGTLDAVRDSTYADGPDLAFSPGRLVRFLTAVKVGRFDRR